MHRVALITAIILPIILFTGCSSLQGSPHAKSDDKSVPTKPWEEIANEASTSSAFYEDARQIGTITASELSEISGIAPSYREPDVYWVHNDSGGKARIYAVDSNGKRIATFDVSGATNIDWEDIASVSVVNSEPALYIADIGNNHLDREELVIYRVGEPKLASEKSGLTETAEAFYFRYPDGQHDAEAIFVDPDSEQIYVVTKTATQNCRVYRFPNRPRSGEHVTLEIVKGKHIASVESIRLVTGAATSPDGNRVIIRTYFSAFEFQRAKGAAFDSIFDREPVTIKVPQMRQGEAVAYSSDGKAIVMTSEKLPAPIFQMNRK